MHQVFSACCGYAESLAVDTSNYAQIAFWSNATAFPNLFVYEGLDANDAQAGPGRAFGQPQTAPRNDSVPLVADGAGNTFMAWAGGYPTATAFAVNAFQAGNLGWSAVEASPAATRTWDLPSTRRTASGRSGRGERGARAPLAQRRASLRCSDRRRSAGVAKLAAFKRHMHIVIGATGYAPASFKRP